MARAHTSTTDDLVKKVSLIRQIPTPVWIIAIISILLTSSSALIFTLTPLFMRKVMHASMTDIGLLEGIVESIALMSRLMSGMLSDYLARRKLLILIGYGLSTFGKLLIPFALTMITLFFTRSMERLGNGLQAAPRDAFVGDVAPRNIRGTCYGLRQSLGKTGSVLGALAVFFLASYFATSSSDGKMGLSAESYQMIFFLGAIPSIIGFFLLLFFIHDVPHPKQSPDKPYRHPLHMEDIKRLGYNFWFLMSVVVVFNLAHCSEAFLGVRALDVGVPEAIAPLIMALMNTVLALSSFPIGIFSDRLGRKKFLILGFLCLIIADLFLAFSDSFPGILVGVIFWGLQMAMTQAMFTTLVSDTTPNDLRGTAFGVFYVLSGMSILAASPFMGYIWDHFGSTSTFLTSIAITIISLCLVIYISIDERKRKNRADVIPPL